MYEYYDKQIIFSQIYVVDRIAVIVECCAWLSPLFMPFIPVIASGIPELFKMKESCVEPGHFTTILVNLEEENIYKYILALEA
jgi:hypothetical protein